MDKIKDMMHGGHHKEGEQTTSTTMDTGAPGTGYDQSTEGHHEKKGLFGLGGHKKVRFNPQYDSSSKCNLRLYSE
jgi:hypothetical protein